MTRWTHVDDTDHDVDPHYEGRAVPMASGKLTYWTCHKCRTEVRLDGAKVPITAPDKRDAVPEGDPR